MDGRADSLYTSFLTHFNMEATACQDALFRKVAEFLTGDDADTLVVDGYAGTGKTTAISAVISSLASLGIRSILSAPTGRSAKVLSQICGKNASTIHKMIYRQKSVGSDGYGKFTLAPNKSRDTLFVVDEASLLGIGSDEGQAAFGSGNLLADLMEFVRNGVGCRLILMGDSAQLPPIGFSESPALSEEFMSSAFSGVTFATLSTVVRQAETSGILRNATAVRLQLSSAEAGHRLQLRTFPDVERIGGGELIDAISDACSRYGEDNVMILCRSNKRALRYNIGIRSKIQYKEESLVRDDRLMIVRNCYQFCEDVEGMEYIANGDIAKLVRIRNFEDRYGLHFADARLCFPDYDDVEINAKVCLDVLESESASLGREQQDRLFHEVWETYADRGNKKKIWEAVREDPYFNALQFKYAYAVTCHKSQGGQWDCIFIDSAFWQDEFSDDDLKWIYTALTRAVRKVYLVNFRDSSFAPSGPPSSLR